MDREKVLDKAKYDIFMSSKAVFLNSVLFNLGFKWSESIPTACTDGIDITINPHWFNDIAPKERVGLLLHEAWHVGLEHHLRCENRDPKGWNDACDIVIDNMLVEEGFELPKPDHTNPQYKGWSEEDIYDQLIKDKKEEEPEPDTTGDIVYPLDKEDFERVKEHIKENILSAAIQADLSEDSSEAGSVPSDVQRRIDKWLNPPIPWDHLIRRAITERMEEEYTWDSPDRRYYALDLVLPSLSGEGLKRMNFYVDASYSVSDEDFSRAVNSIQQAINTVKTKELLVAEFDTYLREPKILKAHEFRKLKTMEFEGKGGTQIKDVLDHIVTENPPISIIFTDGWFYEYVPKKFSQYVIWIINDNPDFTYPVGKVIHIDTERGQ